MRNLHHDGAEGTQGLEGSQAAYRDVPWPSAVRAAGGTAAGGLPSAEVQGHSPEQRVTVPGKRNVQILKIEPVGNYAVRITFDDFHDTGIFTWNYLHTLGHEKDARWAAYLAELEEKGLSRDR